jgi:DNA-binding winged helix-turn-helix (wHTH) protein
VEATDGKTPGAQHETYTFGHHQLDVTARRLTTAAGAEVPLAPRCFDLLVALVRRGDRAVPRDELIEAVWGETIVEEGNLAWTIKELRRALGNDAQTIETVRGFGYRFVRPTLAATEDVRPRRAEDSGATAVATAPGARIRWASAAAVIAGLFVVVGLWWIATDGRTGELDAGDHERLAIEADQRGAEALALDHVRRGLELVSGADTPLRHRLAARVALWSGDWPTVLTELDRLGEDLDRDLELALWRPRAHAHLGDRAAAERELGRLSRLPDPIGGSARIDLTSGWLAQRAGDWAGAKAAAERALAAAARGGEPDVLVEAAILRTEVATGSGELALAQESCRAGLEGARSAGLVRLELRALLACARAAMVMGDLDRATDYLADGLQRARARGTRTVIAPLLVGSAFVDLASGRLADATTRAFEALGVARDVGAVDDEAAALRLLSLVARLSADLDAAERWAREGLTRAAQIPHAARLALLNAELGRVLVERGVYVEAEQAFEAAARAEAGPSDASRALDQISLGWCRLVAGEPKAARALAEGVLQRLAGPIGLAQAEAWSLIAEAAADEGNAAVARRAVAALSTLPRRHPPLDAGWRLALARGLAAAGERELALAELEALLEEPTLEQLTLVRLEAAVRRAELLDDREAIAALETELRARGLLRLVR